MLDATNRAKGLFARLKTSKGQENIGMEEQKKFKRTLVTTALPYANGPVHIGHLAGVYVPADIYTRYLRL